MNSSALSALHVHRREPASVRRLASVRCPGAEVSHARAGSAGAIDFEEARRRYLGEAERRLYRNESAGLLREMIDYHLSAGGKRLRAILPAWVCHNLGGTAEEAIDLGVGLELIHNATLAHDDIQDGDTHRRGRTTAWRRYGVAQAINLGDALIFEAFARIARAPAAPRLFEHISRALTRTVEGQAADLAQQLPERRECPPSEREWMEMARGKTGALLGACVRAGAVAAGADEALAESAARYGEDIGLLFQVQDDYLDLVGDKGRERRGSDLVEGKLSYPIVWALEHGAPATVAPIRALLARSRDARTWEMADAALDALARANALDATADWLRAAAVAAEAHPLAAAVPGLAARCLAPVAHALGLAPR
ncbi:MAG: polyprenyl synthetase family protein [Minicystis sp.]